MLAANPKEEFLVQKVPPIPISLLSQFNAKLAVTMKETKSCKFPYFPNSRMYSESANKVYRPRIQYERQQAARSLDMGGKFACESTAGQALHWHQATLGKTVSAFSFTQPLWRYHCDGWVS